MDELGFIGALVAGTFMILLIIFIAAFVLSLLIYVYRSLAFMYIGKKTGDNLAPLAWIPYVGNAIVAYRASGMHWWPWIFVGLYLVIMFPAMIFEALILQIIGVLSGLVYGVFFLVWLWKLFEKANWPGWMALLYIIPIVNLVVLGMVAWMKR